MENASLPATASRASRGAALAELGCRGNCRRSATIWPRQLPPPLPGEAGSR